MNGVQIYQQFEALTRRYLDARLWQQIDGCEQRQICRINSCKVRDESVKVMLFDCYETKDMALPRIEKRAATVYGASKNDDQGEYYAWKHDLIPVGEE